MFKNIVQRQLNRVNSEDVLLTEISTDLLGQPQSSALDIEYSPPAKSVLKNGFSNEQQKQLFSRIQWAILPILFCMILFCYIDRTNLSFAALQMFQDLNLSCEAYGLGSGIFFLGYALFQVPSNLIVVRVGAPVWLGMLICGWGAVAMGFAWVKNETQFVLVRLLLGVFEAGAFPGMWYYMSLFFPSSNRVIPFTVVESAIAISQVVAPPIAAGLLSLDGVGGLRGWQWVFIAEGIPTIIVGIVTYSFLPKNLQKANFVTESEKQWIQSQLRQQQDVPKAGGKKSTGQETDLFVVWEVLRSPTLWYFSSIKFLRDLQGYGVLFWLPMIIYSMLHENEDGSQNVGNQCSGDTTQNDPDSNDEYKQVMSVLLTSIPYALASVTMFINGMHSQRTGEHRFHAAVPMLLGGFVFTMFPYVNSVSKIGGFIVLVITIVGGFGAGPVLLNVVTSHTTERTLPAALPIFNSIGNIGGFLGPYFYGIMLEATGSYTMPTVILGLCFASSGLMVLFIDEHTTRISNQQDEVMK